MSDTRHGTFVPILTVLPEPGPAYIWIVRRPDQGGVGPNLCDLMGWDDSFPMSHGLWQKFDDWALQYCWMQDDAIEDQDWSAFHARGIQLSRWLKEEVGDTFRVVYYKTADDPDHAIDERTEILADGTLLPLVPFC